MANPTIGRPVFQPRPPERGSFPLDHDGECKSIVSKYLKCLHSSKLNSSECRIIAKDYLQCRMDNNLMRKEKMEDLGFGDLVSKKNEKDNEKDVKKL